jgi:hypothetical protein
MAVASVAPCRVVPHFRIRVSRPRPELASSPTSSLTSCCVAAALSPSQSSHPKPPKLKLFSVDFAFPESPKVLSIISHSFDPLEFAFFLLNPQILETLEILIHQNVNVDSC